jgi:chemosensory pili system protein ChpA (sensor histidine kinase/response regulator)
MDKELEVRLQFLEEAQEYLDTLEAVVLGLSVTGVDPKKMDGALRAAHSIKGGAALMQFQLLSHTAHRLEDCFKILQARRPEVGEELESLLLSALDSIRQIIEMSREGKDPDEDAMAQPASPLLDQLQDILGEVQPEDETALASQESGHDLVKLFFESEVENNLLRLEEVLAQPGQPCLESELSVLAQELGGLGEMLQLSNFSSLCLSVTQYLETYPAQVAQIATLALDKWRQSQALVLIGQLDLIPSTLDYQSPIAVPEPSDLAPAADNSQQSELELLLSGMDIAPIESLLSAPERPSESETQPELALENWPELESLLSDLKPEATTEKITEPSLTQPKTEADLGIEALLLGLDLDLFQELEAASPVKKPLAEVIPENEWADLDSLFAELERETPKVTAEAKTDAKEQGIEAGQERTPEIREMDLLANLLDFEAEPVVLEEAKAAPAPLAISDSEELTSDLSEEMGLGMLAAIFDIGVETAPSKPITLTEEEVHSEVEAKFLEVFDIEAAAPVVSPEISEVSPDLGIAAEHEIIKELVAETVLDAEQAILFSEAAEVSPESQPLEIAAEDVSIAPPIAEPMVAPASLSANVQTLQWSDLAAFIEASEDALEATKSESVQPLITEAPLELEHAQHEAQEPEIIEPPVAEEILEAEQLADEQSNQWSEIAAFVKVSAVAAVAIDATVTEADQEHAAEAEHTVEVKNEVRLEFGPPGPPTMGGEASLAVPQLMDADSMNGLWPTNGLGLVSTEHEFPQELVAEAVLAPENQEVFTLETEQPLVLAETSVSEAHVIDLEPHTLDIATEHEIIEPPVAEEIVDAEQPADDSSQWSEIAAFVKVSAIAAVAVTAIDAIEAAVDEEHAAEAENAVEVTNEAPLELQQVQEDIALEHEFPQELVAEAVAAPENQEVFTLETEQPMMLAETSLSEAHVHVIDLEPQVLDVVAEHEIVEEQAPETIQIPEQPVLLLPEASVIAVDVISQEAHALDIAVEQEIIELPVAEEIVDAEQPADDSSQWSEIAAFVKVSAVAAVAIDATVTEADQEHAAEAENAVEVKNEASLELQQVQHDAQEPEIVEPLVVEAVAAPENQEVLTLETEQPLVLAETSVSEAHEHVISLEPQILQETVAETALNSEHSPAEQLPLLSEVALSPVIAEAEPVQELVTEQEQPIPFATSALPALAVASLQTEPASDVIEKSILPKKLERASSNSEANTVRIPAKRLDQLDDLCGDLTIERNGLALYLERLHNLVAGLNTRVRNLEQFNLRLRSAYDQEANQANTPLLGSPSSTTEENFDVLEMDRYSELHLVWQEVMESIVQIQEVTSDIDLTVRSADDTAAELNRTAKQLQSNVMYSRMRPLTDVVGRFPRAIRDLAQQFGKPATLKIQGGSTLIDRTVLGILGDPLMHLLRNAFDHGLEDTETRLARGKTAQGTIEIKAFYRGNETIITVSDDGGGINLEKIRDKATRIGFDQAQLAKARPQDLLDLIFEPGFSTADQVTELSGRGVGMDVVRTNLQQVRGKITVNTQPGIGTTFTLSVPVTLSVGRVLLVESQNVMLAFPVDAIEQMALLEEEDDNNSDIFQWENYAVPKLALKEWLNFRGPVRKIETDDMAMMANPAMLILSQGNDLVGVPIERCWGEREVAIRQAEGPIPMPPGFSGCTILGTGQVVPLVSIPGLFNWIADQGRVPKTALPVQSAASQVQMERESILVIDDSINVRRFLAMTLEKAGYLVAQAKDGQDAIEQLTSGLVVNAVICDIEMPRLDGFGFLAQAKANPALKHLPITMLTSRSGDKHRQLALRLGASEYFSKPFKEQELLQALNQLIQSTHLTPTS